MKLNMLFIVMDLFVLLACPIVYVSSKLRQFLRSKESIPSVILLIPEPRVKLGR